MLLARGGRRRRSTKATSSSPPWDRVSLKAVAVAAGFFARVFSYVGIGIQRLSNHQRAALNSSAFGMLMIHAKSHFS